MGFLFGKKNVPDELPDIFSQTSEQKNNALEIKEKPKYQALPNVATMPAPKQIIQQTEQPAQNYAKLPSLDDEDGYFKELVKSVVDGSENIDKLDSWYKEKFMPQDIVFQMREYWQKQQPQILLKNIRGDLKNSMVEKTDKLHKLEQDWQQIYFDLIAKEEEIRKEERELKGVVSEFITAFKASKERFEAKEKLDLKEKSDKRR